MTPNPVLESTQPASTETWHALGADLVLEKTQSSPEGLSDAEAKARLAQYGPNVLQRSGGDGPLQILWRQINNPLIWVLIASGLLAIGLGKVTDGLVVLAVVVLNTIIGFVQEFKAGKAIEALVDMVPENATVVRGGQKMTLAVAELVPGDVVMLASGDKVPADMRLIQVRNLQVEEAALTGESVPTEKNLAPVAETASLGDRINMVFGGTLVTYGTGTAVVVSTGSKTELGRISTLLKEAADLETPLTKALGVIGKTITIGILIVAAIMTAGGMIRLLGQDVPMGEALRETLVSAIALAVGAIPEGLPAIVTIALAIGVQRMAARRAVIRKLPAVETLGSTTTICSDKTGTLTRNEMTVQALWTPSNTFEVTGVGYEPKGELKKGDQVVSELPDDVRELLLAGALCNDSAISLSEGHWKLTGDPTEGALVTAAAKFGIDPDRVRQEIPKTDAIPFESENQFMATLHTMPDGSQRILIKGAPEVVLRRCGSMRGGGAPDEALVTQQIDRLASQGMRVLGFAEVTPGHRIQEMGMHDVESNLVFLGLQGMIDPPRSEAIDAVKACHAAGITVKMITGDHKGTAAAIGRQLGILKDDQPAITGVQLAEMNGAELRQAVNSTNVFARVAPEHKLRLVKALQEQDHVVAMTGDGVNDAPALKQSNIGVAMGITGTAVSKEAADIVLTDDNFASIAAAVEEGRRVYDNLIKSLAFVLPTNLGLAFILMAGVCFFPFVNGELLLPMAPTQLLWINLVATVALALPLAFEAMEPNVMSRPPRDPNEPVLNKFVVFRTFMAAILMTIGAVGLFIYERNSSVAAGISDVVAVAKAQTMAVTTVIMFQIFYMLNCRSLKDSIFKIGFFSNKSVFVGIVALIGLQMAFIYAPPLQSIFGTQPLAAKDILLSVLVGTIILPVITIEKALRKRVER